MAEPKGIGKKILGVFFETPEGEAEAPASEEGKSAADMVAELANASGAGLDATERAAPPPPPPNLKLDKMATPAGDPGAKIDFDAIFKQGGLDPAGLEKVNKAETLLKGLPDATPVDVKKQIVEASLKAFGIDIVTIIQATNTQLQALDLYVKVNSEQTAKAISAAEEQIKQHNEKIAALRADIDKRNASLASASAAAMARKADVEKILSFFGNKPAV